MAGYSFEKYKPKPKKPRGRSGSRSGGSGRGGSRGRSGGSSRGRPSGGRGRDSGRSRSGGSRSGGSRGGSSRGRSDSSRGREFRSRESRSNDSGYKRKDNRNSGRTAVTCAGCGADCFVPFKPMTDKPLFCDNCFSKDSKPKKRGRDESPKSSGISEHQLDIINEKLNKIMKALNLD